MSMIGAKLLWVRPDKSQASYRPKIVYVFFFFWFFNIMHSIKCI